MLEMLDLDTDSFEQFVRLFFVHCNFVKVLLFMWLNLLLRFSFDFPSQILHGFSSVFSFSRFSLSEFSFSVFLSEFFLIDSLFANSSYQIVFRFLSPILLLELLFSNSPSRIILRFFSEFSFSRFSFPEFLEFSFWD